MIFFMDYIIILQLHIYCYVNVIAYSYIARKHSNISLSAKLNTFFFYINEKKIKYIIR